MRETRGRRVHESQASSTAAGPVKVTLTRAVYEQGRGNGDIVLLQSMHDLLMALAVKPGQRGVHESQKVRTL